METEFKRFEELVHNMLELNGEYIRRFISLGVKYNRSETLELANEYMDKYDELTDKLNKSK